MSVSYQIKKERNGKDVERKKVLEVNDLSKRYDNFLLSDVSFTLEEGRIVGMIGPNGAGKSTTMKLILGIIKPDQGNIIFQGDNRLFDDCKAYKEKIGYVGEATDFFSKCKLSGIKNFYKSFYRTWDDHYYAMVLERLQLSETYKMEELSKGMRVKFSLCLALSHKPELLLMDEPTSGLDPLIRNDILAILRDYAKDHHASIMFSSHITEDMEKIADKLLFIYKGKIIDKRATEELTGKGIAIDVHLENLIKGGERS